jgi:hypothetical protein
VREEKQGKRVKYSIESREIMKWDHSIRIRDQKFE